MYTSIAEFKKDYGFERATTLKVLQALTDESLATCKSSDDPQTTICQLGWHVATAPDAILGQAGLTIHNPAKGSWVAPEGTTAASIAQTYEQASSDVLTQVDTWNDGDLGTVKNFFGMEWPLGAALMAVIHHEIHHRGQLSVMMRQAGLTVPSIYGPNREETMEFIKNMQSQQPAEG
jgi:uncharacterized damage-inducible protein DinB